jgi:hydroxyacylglutathione hydrolase
MYTLTPIPAFDDNYLWLLDDGHDAWVVDPGDEAPVQAYLQARGLRLAGILLTHHHADHTGGVAALRQTTGARVYGPAYEALPEPVQRLAEGDAVQVLGLRFQVMEVPGHTSGHIAYFAASVNGAPLLFCGDTLFSAGCGRLFEGTPAQMLDSLQRLANLPDDTRICCAHEYTLSNLRFALAVEPGNTELQAYHAECQALRARGRPTLPAHLQRERAINPFLRSHLPSVATAVRAQHPAAQDPVAVFAGLREWKNGFR